MCQSCTGPPGPPSLQSCIGLLQKFVFLILRNFHTIFNFVFREIFLEFCENQNYLSKFHVLQTFDEIIFNFAKLEEKFTKHEIKNFAATLLLHNLPSATHPPLPSARRFFNAARQCYFEMKTNKEPCFSILSFIIL